MIRFFALTAGASIAVLSSAPAAAQDQGGDRVNQVIIFGQDECPQSEGDTITVCARLDEGERYRIPPRLRTSNSPDNEAWSRRAQSFETIGRFGPMSCTATGAFADLGCTAAMIETAYAERAAGSDVHFGQLIEQERAERLSTIDADAAAMQERVESLERAYTDRLEAERDAEDTAAPATDGAEPADLTAPPGS